MSPDLISDLKADEGLRLTAYPDPLSGGDPWTIGYGCTGPGIAQGTVWTQEQADDALCDRVDALDSEIAHYLPWFRSINDERQSVLINMAYNMGLKGLLAFRQTLGAVEAGNYDVAAADMLASTWAHQVPHRAGRLARQMASGVHESA